jgi:ribosomal protein L11 methyltransferase
VPWLSVTVVVDMACAEALSDALLERGAVSTEVTDADAGTPFERPIFDEPGGAPSAGWARARVAALFPIDHDVSASMAASCDAIGIPQAGYAVDRLEDEDWVRKTQAQFGPQQITSRLWVVPTWHAPPDAAAINVMLDPGLAFGTGTHPTTRLCLRWLERQIAGGESVIDFGCGSGILAIAALKLGAGRASGVDIDREAVETARRNAAQNGVTAEFTLAGESLPAPADLVVANILAQPLIVLAPVLSRLTVRGGRIALSGILRHQACEVSAAYRPWYDLDPLQEEGGWVLVCGSRRS